MFWLDVERARAIVEGGNYSVVTHGGLAHGDDLLAVALWWERGAPVYRLNTLEDVLAVEGNVVLVDIGDAFRDRLPRRFAVLDHHGSPDEPSSIVQTMLALRTWPPPQSSTFIHFVDLFDRLGPRAKKWSSVYGQSLIYGLTRYISDAAPKGLIRESRFLGLLAEAFRTGLDFAFGDLAQAYKVAEKLDAVKHVEEFPRTFAMLRLMLRAAHSLVDAALSPEAAEVGFGLDFGAYAIIAVPELEQYIVKGLESYFAENVRAIDIASTGRYALLEGEMAAIYTEERIAPRALWNALMDLGVLGPDKKAVVVVRDVRTPGAYTVWRPDTHPGVDLRTLEGDWVAFKHPNGFMAVVRASSAEEAARLVLNTLARRP